MLIIVYSDRPFLFHLDNAKSTDAEEPFSISICKIVPVKLAPVKFCYPEHHLHYKRILKMLPH